MLKCCRKLKQKWNTYTKKHHPSQLFQHLTEIFPALLLVWKEENPSLILPRHIDDWRSQNFLRKIVSLVDWGGSAAMAWARCLLVFSLRIVPVVNMETARLAQDPK